MKSKPRDRGNILIDPSRKMHAVAPLPARERRQYLSLHTWYDLSLAPSVIFTVVRPYPRLLAFVISPLFRGNTISIYLASLLIFAKSDFEIAAL